MKEIAEEDYKKIPFEILLDVTDFCKRNEIRYSLAYGTLLGAIRHKGFIPWDDDVDIIMPRNDYENFKQLYHSDRYVFSDFSINPKHPTHMGKVYDTKTFFYSKEKIKRDYGLFIDVFVVDHAPADSEERLRWMKKLKHLMLVYSIKNTEFAGMMTTTPSLKVKIIKGCIKCIPVSKSSIKKKIMELSQRYDHEQTGWVGITVSVDNPFDFYPSDLFENYINTDFENHSFSIIRDYDLWLKKCYGDYMQLPPEEKRIGRHGIIAYYK